MHAMLKKYRLFMREINLPRQSPYQPRPLHDAAVLMMQTGTIIHLIANHHLPTLYGTIYDAIISRRATKKHHQQPYELFMRLRRSPSEVSPINAVLISDDAVDRNRLIIALLICLYIEQQ